MPGKADSGKKAKGSNVKSKDNAMQTTANRRKSELSARPVAAQVNASWETDLLEVYGKTVSLSHPHLSSGQVSMEYGLSPSVVPLQEGITVRPGRALGQVSAYNDEVTGTKSVIFSAIGGEVEFAPPNLEGVKAIGELAVATFVAEESLGVNRPTLEEEQIVDRITLPPVEEEQVVDRITLPPVDWTEMEEKRTTAGTTEISMFLKEPLVIQPMEGFRMELGDAEYIKQKSQPDPKLKFHRTKLTYENQMLSANFETESDKTGLRLLGGKNALALDMYALRRAKKDVAPEATGANFLLDDSGATLEFLSGSDRDLTGGNIQEKKAIPEKENGAEETWEEHAELTIGEAKFFLHGVRKNGEKIVSADWGQSFYHGFDLKLHRIQINGQEELSGEEITIFPLTNADMKIQCDQVSCSREGGLQTKFAMLKRGEQEYALNGVTFGESEKIAAETVCAEINGYNATLYNAMLQPYGEIAYETAEVRTVLHFGLNKGNKKAVYNENAQTFFTFRLGKGVVFNDQFGVGTQALNLASKQRYTERAFQISSNEKRITFGESRSSEMIEQDIFTDDGFVQMENAQFDFQNDGEESASIKGMGEFKFLEIPYDIVIPGRKSHLTGTTQEKGDPEDKTDFSVSGDGKINAKFEKPIQLPMLKLKNESESLINVLTLKDPEIKDSVLTAKSIRIDRGMSTELDLEDRTESEKAKELFGVGLKGTMADVGGKAELSRDKGITGNTEKKQLGQFAVSNFLGYLDISGDYSAGKFHAALKKEKEEENEHSKQIFGEKDKYVTDAGLSIPIAGPLSFEFGVKTSLGIGGELSADLAREDGKSFGEEMEPGQSMALEGNLKVKGSASVGVSTGLALGVSALVTNLMKADIKLNAALSSAFETTLQGGTALGAESGTLKQTKDLEINGELDVTLGGALSLTSDVKFLIWKANIFTLELGKKEIKLTTVHGKAIRVADPKDPKKAWNFESLDLSADAFGKKAGLALKNQGEAKKEPLAVTAARVEAIGSDALGAWTILEDLKREQTLNGEHVYFMEKAEQMALNAKIQAMTATVQEKLMNYVSVLASYESRLKIEESSAAEAVNTARKEQLSYQQRDDVRQQTLIHTAAGGFDLANYRQMKENDLSSLVSEELLVAEKGASKEKKAEIRNKNEEIKVRNKKIQEKKTKLEIQNKGIRAQNMHVRKMASVDFSIARILGIYDNAMRYVEDSYDVYSEVQNMKMLAQNRETPDRDLFKKRTDMKDYEFIFGDFGTWGRATEQLKYLTRFGNDQNYFNALYARASNHKDLKGFGIYQAAFWKLGPKDKPIMNDMSGYELLQVILSDKYPKGACDPKKKDDSGKPVDLSGKMIGGMPEEKLEAVKHLFKDHKNKESWDDAFVRSLLGWEKMKDKQQSMLEDTDKVYQALFESNVQTMTHKGNVDIGRKLEELDQKLEQSKEKYLDAVKKHLDAQTAVAKVQAEQADCKVKLAKLRGDVAKGVTLAGQAVAGATDAVDFMEKEYQAIESGKTMMDAVAEYPEAMEKLKKVK